MPALLTSPCRRAAAAAAAVALLISSAFAGGSPPGVPSEMMPWQGQQYQMYKDRQVAPTEPAPAATTIHFYPQRTTAHVTLLPQRHTDPDPVVYVMVHLPKGADMWVEGEPMIANNQADEETLVSPPLEEGETYTYHFRIRWFEDGKWVHQMTARKVQAGDVICVDVIPSDATAVHKVERVHDLDLTDAQETKIAGIRKQHRPKVQAAAKQLGALIKEEEEKIRDVLTPAQQKQVQGMTEERKDHREESVAHAFASLRELDLTDAEMARIGEIRREYRPKIASAVKEMSGLLTDEQRKAREEGLRAGKSRREIMESLNLTDAQKDKMRGAARQVRGLVREETEKIQDVLTESQKERLQELQEERKERVRDRRAHRIENLKELNLTDDQKARITAIRQEYRPKVHEAGNKLRAAVREEVEQIMTVFKE